MTISRFRLFVSLLIGAGLSAATARAAGPAPGDYDGDGRSDLAVVDVSKTKSRTYWYTLLSSAGQKTFTFDVPGDALSPGNFFGETHANPAAVFVRDAKERLEWHIRTDSQGNVIRRFGMPGSTPVPGDYDCDGVMDLAVRTPSKDNGLWSIAFATGQAANNILFGFSEDRVFGADVDGDGCDEMVAVRNVKGLMYWFYRKFSNSQYATVQWGLPGDIPLKPLDMNADAVPDLIVVRTINRQLFAVVRFSEASSLTVPLGPSTTIPLTGNWLGSNGFGWYDTSSRIFYLLNITNGQISTVKFPNGGDALVRPDGSVAQFEGDERLGVAAADDNDDIQCDKTLKKRDGSGNFTYNPNNSRKTLKVILPSSYNGKVRSIKAAKNGDFLDTLRQATPNEWGNRPRYYGSKGLGSYPKSLLIVISRTDGTQHCVTIDDPRQRQD